MTGKDSGCSSLMSSQRTMANFEMDGRRVAKIHSIDAMHIPMIIISGGLARRLRLMPADVNCSQSMVEMTSVVVPRMVGMDREPPQSCHVDNVESYGSDETLELG